MKHVNCIFKYIIIFSIPLSTYAQMNNTLYGFNALSSLSTGSYNSAFGDHAGSGCTNENFNSFFGDQAGAFSYGGNKNSFFGRSSGQKVGTNNNAFFGYSSGENTTGGEQSSFFGSDSGQRNISGSDNNFFGFQSGQGNTTGHDNVYIGALAGRGGLAANPNSGTGRENVFIGNNSGWYITSGIRNVFIGKSAGALNETGGNNVYIGATAGGLNRGSNNVFIGSASGPKGLSISSISNQLFIHNEASNTPLIYGEFDNDLIRINGEFEAMGGMSQSSDFYAKEEILEIDYNSILEKVDQLEISEWQYKDYNERRHIGPMAQDFHAAFGLGDDDTKISTLDADGVALAAIKALKMENDQLRKMNVSLVERLDLIEKHLKIDNNE